MMINSREPGKGYTKNEKILVKPALLWYLTCTPLEWI